MPGVVGRASLLHGHGPCGACLDTGVAGGGGGGGCCCVSAMWSLMHAYRCAGLSTPLVPFPAFPPPGAASSSPCVRGAVSFEDSSSMESHHYRSMDHSPTDMYGLGKARKSKEDKYCGVCGDRALGYNFDAISCESCKAFFRRNAPKGLDYFKCPYDDKCKMDVSNRRFCKRCRLRKCFEIGMRKEYILTEEEKMRKRMRIEENRRFREVDPKSRTMGQQGQQGQGQQQISDVTSSQVRLRPLEPEEDSAIHEVVSAYHQSLEICVESDISREKPTMIDVVNIAEISVRRVIDMSKKIKSFKALTQADQIGLLKGGSIELLIIRSVITFDKDKQQFLDPYDKEKYAMTTEQFKIATDSATAAVAASSGSGSGSGSGTPGGSSSSSSSSPASSGAPDREQGSKDLFEDHMRFVRSLALDLHADETVLILLLMIALFSPDRPAITDKHYVATEQERYALLLLRYLQSKHAPHVVKMLYPKLLMKLVDIRNLNEVHSQVLLRINPDGLQPLMKEVLEHNLDRKPGSGGPLTPSSAPTSALPSPGAPSQPLPPPPPAVGSPGAASATSSSSSPPSQVSSPDHHLPHPNHHHHHHPHHHHQLSPPDNFLQHKASSSSPPDHLPPPPPHAHPHQVSPPNHHLPHHHHHHHHPHHHPQGSPLPITDEGILVSNTDKGVNSPSGRNASVESAT
ncbi:vitamin D3 receptor-like [Babylonia areolata]|uniref:vitamin D3 receptor-like n=1 Tax=Babylonia areolata TaxID=304850 RepID=UPI003FD5AACF